MLSLRHILIVTHLVNFINAGKVILVVTEGLTEDLLSHVATPALDALAAKGNFASLKPEFPAETLPTLAAMMTGHHTEMTGVLDREVTDGQGGVWKYDTDPEFWNYDVNMTTIWDLTKVSEKKTGCIQWPGTGPQFDNNNCQRVWNYGGFDIVTDVNETSSEERSKRSLDAVEIDRLIMDEDSEFEELEDEGAKVDNADNESEFVDESYEEISFNKTTDKEWIMWESQISSIIQWFSDKTDRVDFVVFNVGQPGDIIRTYGPGSGEAKFALQKVDQMIAHLVEELQMNKLYEDMNIVVTGVHGFVEVTADKVVEEISGDLADKTLITGHSPVLNIRHSDNDLAIYSRLKKEAADKYDVYIKNDLPGNFFYVNNDRVGAITLVAKEAFAFYDIYKDWKKLNSEHKRAEYLDNVYGVAGYDNTLDSMQSIVIMQGPGVRQIQGQDHVSGIPSINAVDVFPLLCHLLEVPEIKTHGSLQNVRSLLKNPPSQTFEAIEKVIEKYISHDKLPNSVLILTITTAAVLLLICCCACAIRRRNKDLGKNHNYKYSSVKHNRRSEEREDGSDNTDDKVGLLTSAIMEEEMEENLPV